MKSYIIIFEFPALNSSTRKNLLMDRIREYGFFAFLTSNSCILFTEESVVEVRDKLLKIIDPEDKIFVGELNAPAAWSNSIGKEVSEWIINYLKQK